MHVAVLYGSVRSGRTGIKAARFLVNKLEERGHSVALIDPAQHELPLLDRMYKQFEPDEAPAAMQYIHEQLEAADGIMVVTAEYNHSVPPALKNLLDHYQSEYAGKPGAIATYSAGPFGGVRVGPHMRAILGELGMVTPSIMFAISAVGKSFDDDGTAIDKNYERRVERFLNEFEWYMDALKTKRDQDGKPY